MASTGEASEGDFGRYQQAIEQDDFERLPEEESSAQFTPDEESSDEEVAEAGGSVEVDPSEVLLADLREQLTKDRAAAVFCCGGSLPITSDPSSTLSSDNPVCKPITVRWESASASSAPRTQKLTLPLSGSEALTAFTQLLEDSQAASFGRGGEEVYDETYRKALKLDESAFSTNFSPYEIGIIDQITNLLLPFENVMVKAELYKLNIYSGPSGEFKAHVDTPRSINQFGSLVVCLPIAHEGGDLHLSHGTIEKSFSWSALSSIPTIQWAAFYSDVVHAVLPVTSGHRLTLTYNLYSVPNAFSPPLLEPNTLPLYEKVNCLLENPEFLPEGGHIGIICTHAYPHTSAAVAPNIRCALKGVDRAVFATFCALGLDTDVRPVATIDHNDWESEEDPIDVPPSTNSKYIINPRYNILAGESHLKPVDRFNYLQTENPRERVQMWVGGNGDGGLANQDTNRVDIENVFWLAPAKVPNWELQLALLSYGNQPALDLVYSFATIVARVPRWAVRSGAEKEKEKERKLELDLEKLPYETVEWERQERVNNHPELKQL